MFFLFDRRNINPSLVKDSGAWPMLCAIMESDLHFMSKLNLLFNFADDTTFVFPVGLRWS